jgi:hypothetical protein
MAVGLFIQQQLVSCELCSDCLAVQYGGNHGRLTSTRTTVRPFRCPSCGHANPVIVPLYAGPFVTKSVPGPVLGRRAHANGVRRLWLAAGRAEGSLAAPKT